jgi:hypothetical protein
MRQRQKLDAEELKTKDNNLAEFVPSLQLPSFFLINFYNGHPLRLQLGGKAKRIGRVV